MVQAPIYVFDGHCVLCSRAVQYVLQHDRAEPPTRFVVIKSGEGRKLSEAEGVDPDAPSTFIYFDETGQSYKSSDAIIALAKRLTGPWRFLRVAVIIPKPVRHFFYARLANNRYRLFGQMDQCYVPDASTRDRFVLE